MNTREILSELKRDEGIRLKPYRDSVGKMTIGVGRNLTDVGLSMDEAEIMLMNDVDRTIEDLDRALPWWRTLDEVRQRVLVNMGFNMGVAEIARWRNWHALIQSGQYDAAADAMLRTLWARQVGPRATRLADLMRRGEAPAPTPPVA